MKIEPGFWKVIKDLQVLESSDLHTITQDLIIYLNNVLMSLRLIEEIEINI